MRSAIQEQLQNVWWNSTLKVISRIKYAVPWLNVTFIWIVLYLYKKIIKDFRKTL